MTAPKIEPLKLDTFLSVIRASVGVEMFRHFYALVDNERGDITRDGDLSCAFFVSFVLTGFGFIDHMHGTVRSTVGDLEKSGWGLIQEPQEGCVIVWDTLTDEKTGESHAHIGFYVGDGRAISNSSKDHVPALHPYDMNGRTITGIYWNPELK